LILLKIFSLKFMRGKNEFEVTKNLVIDLDIDRKIILFGLKIIT